MSDKVKKQPGFDPDFDDTQWTDDWLYVPVAQVPPGTHPNGYRVERRVSEYFEVFGEPYRMTRPIECRLLFDPQGRLWMSDTPQERIMMYNNGRRSRGHVLVGGLGLGLYPQFAVEEGVGRATRFTVIEQSPEVRAIVEPTLSVAVEVPMTVQTGDVEAYLKGPVTTRYDTIFLDTWETLDAAHLPSINRLRDLALRHLAPGGRVLLWGYRWMVRLFETACRQLLAAPPEMRRSWLASQAEAAPAAATLLRPVVERFAGQALGDLESVLDWCRRYVVQKRAD